MKKKKGLLFSFLLLLFALLLASPLSVGVVAEMAHSREAAHVNNGTYNMRGGTISGRDNSGLYITGGKVNLYSGTIKNNTSTSQGGGIYAYNTTLTMTGGTITGNSAKYDGGVTLQYATMTMSSGYVQNNQGTYCGGGVGVYNGSLFTMSGGTISGNTAYYGGGGVTCMGTGSTFRMTAGTISGNTGTQTTSGGGVFLQDGTFEMTGGTITGNTATNGSAVYMQTDQVGSTFTYTAGTVSGEIYIGRDSTLILKKEPTSTFDIRLGYDVEEGAKVAKLSGISTLDLSKLNVTNAPADSFLVIKDIDGEKWVVVTSYVDVTITVGVITQYSSLSRYLQIDDYDIGVGALGSYTTSRNLKIGTIIKLSAPIMPSSYRYNIYIGGSLSISFYPTNYYKITLVFASPDGKDYVAKQGLNASFYCDIRSSMLPNVGMPDEKLEGKLPKVERWTLLSQEQAVLDTKKFYLEPVTDEKVA